MNFLIKLDFFLILLNFLLHNVTNVWLNQSKSLGTLNILALLLIINEDVKVLSKCEILID